MNLEKIGGIIKRKVGPGKGRQFCYHRDWSSAKPFLSMLSCKISEFEPRLALCEDP